MDALWWLRLSKRLDGRLWWWVELTVHKPLFYIVCLRNLGHAFRIIFSVLNYTIFIKFNKYLLNTNSVKYAIQTRAYRKLKDKWDKTL